jgi:putative ABC transport system permease protein
MMHWYQRLFRRARTERQLDAELRFHLEQQIADYVATGMTPEEARRRARLEFGGLDQVKEECRDVGAARFIETLIQDMRYGLRQLGRNPGFTTVAIITLALGIGANTAIFSVVNAALLRPLPYPNPSRLVVVWNQLKLVGLNHFPASLADYSDYKSSNKVFESIAAIRPAYLDLTAAGQPERVYGIRASANVFPLLGVSAERGRTFTDQENQPGRDNVALLSDALWKRRYGGDPAIIGKTVTLDGSSYTVVGILPRGFRFSTGSPDMPDVWLPLALGPDPERQAGGNEMIARMKPNVSLRQAQADMKTVAARLEEQYHLYRGPHGEDAGYGVSVVPLQQQIFGSLRDALLLMLAAVGFVLLIACANVGNLLLARSNSRQREITVRAALGASPNRLARQLLAESLPLALFGGGFGLIFAEWGVRLLTSLSPDDASRIVAARLDPAVLLFTAGIALLTALISGFGPAVRASKANLNAALKEGEQSTGASSNRLGSGLMVAQVALSLILLTGAGLLVRSLLRLKNVSLGFDPENIITARISLPASEYRDHVRVEGIYSKLLDRVRRLHGIRSASLISVLPLSGAASRDPFSIEGRPWRPHGADGVPQVANLQVVAVDYFHTMRIPLLKGRDFSKHDAGGAPPVAIVNQALVRGFWPGRDPIGQHIMMGAPRPGAAWLTIVGVAGDVRNTALDAAPIPQIYVTRLQQPVRTMTLVLETGPGSDDAISGVRRILHSLDPKRPLYAVFTMDEILSKSVATQRYNAALLSLFALLAATLAAVGIYGVVSYSVNRQTHEIGIRMALGAQKSDVLRMVVGQGLKLTLAGVAIGVAGALALTRFVSSLLYGVKPIDALTFTGVSVLLTAVALLACYIPARRAAKVDPMVALRHE